MKVTQQVHANHGLTSAISSGLSRDGSTSSDTSEVPFHDQLERGMARTARPLPRIAHSPGIHAELSYAINGAAIEVHRHIGPGQLEALYERALCEELAMRGLECRSQVAVKALYKDRSVGNYYADIVVENKVIVELKVVSRIAVAHRQQVLTYLRASGLRLGLIMNFNAPVLWREIKRVVL